MASLDTSPLRLVMPDDLEEMSIEFPTGLRADTSCAADVVWVAVPRGTELPVKPECATGLFDRLGERTRRFLEGIIR